MFKDLRGIKLCFRRLIRADGLKRSGAISVQLRINPSRLVSFALRGAYTLKVGPDIQDWYGNDMNQNRNGINGEASDTCVETIRLTGPGSIDLLSITGIPNVDFAGLNATGTIAIPNTGEWHIWETITTTVQWIAGQQIMHVDFDTNGSSGFVTNLNWLELTEPPFAASAGSNFTVNAGATVTFAGAVSGGIESYSYGWTFGDGGTSSGSLTSTSIYANSDTYIVLLPDADGTIEVNTSSLAIHCSAGRPVQDRDDFSDNETIKQGEEIQAGLREYLELGRAPFPVFPRGRHNRVARPLRNGFQGHLDGEIELPGDKRLHRVDDFTAIAFERVGKVIVSLTKEHRDEPVAESIQDAFEDRVIVDLSALQ